MNGKPIYCAMEHKTVENVERVDQAEVEIQGIQGRSQASGSSNAHATFTAPR